MAFSPLYAAAQELDCANPASQAEMTGCAAKSYENADIDLNLAYSIARERAAQLDESMREGDVTSISMLRDAQRSWIVFRDQACAAESHLARYGTMQSQLFYQCLERLTRQRTEDLRFFGEVN